MIPLSTVARGCMGLSLVIAALSAGCQTALSPAAGTTVADDSASQQCLRSQNHRQGCDELVGCVWSYAEGTCVVQR